MPEDVKQAIENLRQAASKLAEESRELRGLAGELVQLADQVEARTRRKQDGITVLPPFLDRRKR